MIHELEIPARKKNILAKKGIVTNDDLFCTYLPRAYKDYRNEYTSVSPKLNGVTGCFIGHPYNLNVKYKEKRSIITFKLGMENDKHINCCIIGQNYMQNIMSHMMLEETIAVCGTLKFEMPYGYSILSPDHISYLDQINLFKKIECVYPKFSGITTEWMEGLLKDELREYDEKERFSELELKQYNFNLPSKRKAITDIHFPKSFEDIDRAKKRLEFDMLYDFAAALNEKERSTTKGTTCVLKDLSISKQLIADLPYSLTDDQRNTVNSIVNQIRDGQRANCLIQGDVGCGKTLVAIILLFAFAENGYQCSLMAPTQILASQHYNQIKEFGDKYGIEVAYLDGSTKSAKRKEIIRRVSSGDIKILVGTHALTSDEIIFAPKKLGLVIVDEEHRFGRECRNKLFSRACDGTSTISMTATPIPRSLCQTLFGENVKIYDIHSMPANRKTVKTGICKFRDESKIFDFIGKELDKGRQVYVICATIEIDEEEGDEESRKEAIPLERTRSVTETAELYQGIFSPKYTLDAISGKLSTSEIDSKINAFKNHETDILISTTVIEVGVNVPNASTIIIQNAERFGLAQLHQLRGRVGRGEHQSFCILESNDSENERLKTMKDCSDGFELSKKDLELRGAGDLIGTEQSGFTEIMRLIFSDQEYYQKIYKFSKRESKLF